MAYTPGDFVQIRNRHWLVEHAEASASSKLATLRLTCIDDDAAGEGLTVVPDAEIGATASTDENWQRVSRSGTDAPDSFRAYMRSLSWKTSTAADRRLFQAPFRAGIRLSAYQLLPLKKALLLPRVNLLIADDVGLGKTVEAGLIVRELLMRGRTDFILVAAPPSMTIQWQEELEAKFGLTFTIIDREHVANMRRMHGYGVNPWMTGARFIISHRLLTEEGYVSGLRDVLGEFRARGLLILDEAHHAAPASGQRYAVDSQFTKAVDGLSQRFEHRLFLSATPHNGHSNSFSRLLEMLDPQRFTRGVDIRAGDLAPVMVRRLKSDLVHSGETFPKRIVDPIELSNLPADTAELRLADMLAAYGDLRDKRLAKMAPQERVRAKIAFIGLQQRLLSSIPAFARTLAAHQRGLQRASKGEASSTSAPRDFVLRSPSDQDEAVTEEAEAIDDNALAELATIAGTADATADQIDAELAAVAQMLALAEANKTRPDARIDWLVKWIRAELMTGKTWNTRRLIIFTEWEDTRRWLQHQLHNAFGDTDNIDKRIAAFTGATGSDRREEVKQAFNRDPAIEPLRILICTDAAREGINLQMRCADLIHMDLPWNPSRIEQRNGRIDRKLQPEAEVRCRYFVYTQRAEDVVLRALVEKTQTIRHELGAAGQVLEARITERLAQEGISRGDAPKQAALIRDEADAKRTGKATEEMDDETAARFKRNEKELAALRDDLEKSKAAVGIDPLELQNVAAIALSRFGVDLPASAKVQGKDITTFRLDPAHDAFQRDPTWARAFDDLRTRRQKKGEKRHQWRKEAPVRALAFEPPIKLDGTDIDDVAHLHLEHRLIRRLLGQFLSYGFQHSLNRATVISSPAAQPRVILLGRLTLFGPGASRLHSEIIPVTATWTDADRKAKPLKPLKIDGDAAKATKSELEAGLRRSRQPSAQIITRLTATADSDLTDLRPALEAHAAEIAASETIELAKVGDVESKSLRELLQAQKRRIADTRKDAERRAAELQLDLFSPAEKEQLTLDRRHWETKLERIERDLETEPKRIRDGYTVVAHRLEPVGLVYLWPETN
jgi:ERCC4-related helicase